MKDALHMQRMTTIYLSPILFIDGTTLKTLATSGQWDEGNNKREGGWMESHAGGWALRQPLASLSHAQEVPKMLFPLLFL